MGVAEIGKFGVASDYAKTQAKFLATQRFLKLLMPVGMTWNEAALLISDKTKIEELNGLLDKATTLWVKSNNMLTNFKVYPF